MFVCDLGVIASLDLSCIPNQSIILAALIACNKAPEFALFLCRIVARHICLFFQQQPLGSHVLPPVATDSFGDNIQANAILRSRFVCLE